MFCCFDGSIDYFDRINPSPFAPNGVDGVINDATACHGNKTSCVVMPEIDDVFFPVPVQGENGHIGINSERNKDAADVFAVVIQDGVIVESLYGDAVPRGEFGSEVVGVNGKSPQGYSGDNAGVLSADFIGLTSCNKQ